MYGSVFISNTFVQLPSQFTYSYKHSSMPTMVIFIPTSFSIWTNEKPMKSATKAHVAEWWNLPLRGASTLIRWVLQSCSKVTRERRTERQSTAGTFVSVARWKCQYSPGACSKCRPTCLWTCQLYSWPNSASKKQAKRKDALNTRQSKKNLKNIFNMMLFTL